MDIAKPLDPIYFPCGQWLSPEKQLHRDLLGSRDPSMSSKSKLKLIIKVETSSLGNTKKKLIAVYDFKLTTLVLC